MTFRLTLVLHSQTGPPPKPLDVVVDAAPETPMTTLASLLREAAGVSDEVVPYLASGRLPLGGVLGESPLRNGAVLGLGAPPPRWRPPTGSTLAVISGPDAGASTPLTARRLVVGRAPTSDLVLEDPEVSRRHLAVITNADEIWLADTGSTNGTWLGETVVTDAAIRLPPEIPVRCGNNLLTATEPDTSPLATAPGDPGFLDIRRPPRLKRAPRGETIRYPPAPPGPPPLGSAWLSVGFSAACSMSLGLLWWFTGGAAGSAGMFGIMAMSPLMLLVQAAAERWSRRREAKAARAEHQAATNAVDLRVQQTVNAEGIQRRAHHPDPVTVATIANGPTGRLWERRPSDDDWLELRLGLACLPARLTVERPDQTDPPQADEHPRLPFVPATVKLDAVGVLGLAGPGRYRLAWWLMAQLGVLRSPRDLRLVLHGDHRSEVWWPARWLPHWQEPDVTSPGSSVVVLDGVDRLPAGLAGTNPRDSRQGGGVFVICLAAEPHLLPELCRATVEVTADAKATLRVDGEDALTGITTDSVTAEWLENVARAVAPLREDRLAEVGPSAPPPSVRLDTLLQLPPASAGRDPTAAWAKIVAERWRATPRKTAVPLGQGSNGPVVVDLVADGPHALVAGTTGAGKSELLQTWLASLAAANRPDELSLLLIDYKGGAAFAECARLPHTAGLVTDLDTALTGRVLCSLTAELHRRERTFAAAGVGDLVEYQALRDDGIEVAMPRLLVVVDEFASLAEEFPDLVDGLVDLARRGRSLGIHLVLATQRPAGVVSAQIRANTALRICLRVTEAQESTDVLGSGVAAGIAASTPGRGYLLRQGKLVPVQVAHASDTCTVVDKPPRPARVVPVLRHDQPAATAVAQTQTGRGDTMLSALVRATCAAAKALGTAPVAPPWLPPLPDRLPLKRLLDEKQQPGAPVGLHDLPHEQKQSVFRLDLADQVHLAIIGGSRSGKTNALRTLAASIASTYSPSAARIFAFDGGGGLSDAVRLPHCDAVVSRGDLGHARRVWHRLGLEVRHRAQQATAAGGTSWPWLVVLMDSWEAGGDESPAGQALLATASEVLRQGASYGLRLAITGGRTLLSSSFSDFFTLKLLLRLPRRDDYALADIHSSEIPENAPPGRALIAGTPVTQVQLAALTGEPSTERTTFENLAADLHARWPDSARHSRPVPALPARVDAAKLPDSDEPWSFPIGIGGDANGTISLRLVETRIALVAGPPGSGKTTTLLTVANAAARHGHRVILLNGRGDMPRPALPGVVQTTDELLRVAPEAAPALILVDDVGLVVDTVVDEALVELMSQGCHRVVLAGHVDDLIAAYRGSVERAKRSRTGVLLAPRPTDGELFALSRHSVGASENAPPGRGLLVRKGWTTEIQVALPTADGQPAVD